MTFVEKRIENARKILKDENSIILITSDVNRCYLSGFSSSAGIMLISLNKAFLILDFRYFESAQIALKNGKVAKNVDLILQEKKLNDSILDILKNEKSRKIYFEDERMTVLQYKNYKKHFGEFARFVPLSKQIDLLRSVKDSTEIKNIKYAQEITDKTFSEMLGILKQGMTEREVALEIDYRLRKNGAEKSSFDTISVFGKKSSLPHGVCDDTIIKNGFLTMDFGAVFNGYCADMTRTVCFGTPSEEMKKVYYTVLKAQNLAFEKIKANVYGFEVDKAARDFIDNSGYEGCFGHSLGHSLGLEIHESPNFSMSEKSKISANVVISVEPGIYLESQFGVRIEDIVVVLENGYENLSKSVKDLVII